MECWAKVLREPPEAELDSHVTAKRALDRLTKIEEKKSLDALQLARRAQRESRYREGRLDACPRRAKRPSKEVPVCAIQH